MEDYKNWRHIFKLDPNKSLDDMSLEVICMSGTDAVIIGGTDGVTFDNTIELLGRVRRYTVPCVLEVSTIASISPGFDYYFIPTVLNSNDALWFKGLHHKAIKEFGPLLNWNELVVEGYCVLNENSKVAKLTNAETDLTEEDVIAYAKMAEKMFRLPIFYIEYSGTYGDPTLVASLKSELRETRLFYGGGIDSRHKALEMANYADTIIVGNVIYENLKEALKTVEAVK
ncbi:heptaprenylglyceryl phosphate synthase [Pueribacillus sp. YX66]|uniref:heptaprenylglyceryl phosphate synthase n=1 Tax=Pueribacillus sp. YX66 TaxID=3229242 RepID=UPI00358CEBDA